MPVMVYTHGLAGQRNMYASTCTSLAAQGYLVAAIEHRDGSASNAAFISADGTAVTYQRYLHTDGKFSYRREQLAKRRGEFNAVVAALTAAAEGKAVRNVFPGSGFNAATLDGAVDMSSLTAIGHSFGGSTVVAAMAHDTSGAIKRAIILDPWVSCMGPDATYKVPLLEHPSHPMNAAAAASVPTLVFLSDGWSGRENLEPLYRSKAPWMQVEVAGVKHQDFSDFPFRMPAAAKRLKAMGSVDVHHLYDFKMSLIHHFFEATTTGVARVKGAEQESKEALERMHTEAVALAGRFRGGGLEAKIRSTGGEVHVNNVALELPSSVVPTHDFNV
mmetsp:Transcript_34064/g.83495  ORF Transcript_34064/g.83495 Transcript_34064/m.83495 type:complete len:331 (+) Transcript_34064:609-1601(+)